MKKLPLSIIIPVSTDVKIRECLKSVDENIEIVVVLNNNPSQEVLNIIEADCRCESFFVEGDGCNLAAVFNVGIKAAKNEKVLLTNSDCFFPPGLIAEMCQKMDRYDVVKARVSFTHSGFRQKLVAECRRLFHHVFDDGTKLFGPGLSFRKSIADRIGGYYFNESMGWGEDGDLSSRIHVADLSYCIVDGCLLHGEEGMWHDLVVAQRIGRGKRLSENGRSARLIDAVKTDCRDFIKDPKRRFRTARLEGGYALALYFLLWKISTYIGYYSQMIREWREINNELRRDKK